MEKGGVSYLFVYPSRRQNSRGMLGEAKGDGGVKTDGCEAITVEVCPDYFTRSHMHMLLSAWITVELFSNRRLSCRTNNHRTLIILFKQQAIKPLTENKYQCLHFLKGRFWLAGFFSKQLITMFCLKKLKTTRNI